MQVHTDAETVEGGGIRTIAALCYLDRKRSSAAEGGINLLRLKRNQQTKPV